jgi:hypothetical protein
MSANGQQHKQLHTSQSSPPAASETPSASVVRSSPNDDNTFEDDDDNNDCEMALLDGVSEADKDNTISNNVLTLENASSNNNFARTFNNVFNNTRRRMSSGLVLSYNFLKGASMKRRDST